MLTYPTVATSALLLLGSQCPRSVEAGRLGDQQREFMRAMKSSNARNVPGTGRRLSTQKNNQDETTPTPEAFIDEIKGDSKRSDWFQRKVIEKATYVPPEEVRARELNNNYGYNVYNNNGNNNNDVNNAAAGDGTDDYYSAYGDWDNAFGFDPTQYSMSYLRCAEVKQYDDEVAAQEDTKSVFSTKHFAIFRFCPAKTCDGIEDVQDDDNVNGNNNANNNGYSRNNNYNAAMYGANYQQNRNQGNQDYQGNEAEENANQGQVAGAAGEGCSSNYGEYMLELQDYLEIMSEYRKERFEAYCEYCEKCAYKVYQKWIQWSKNQDYSNRKLYDITEEGWKRELKERELGNFNALAICPEYNSCKIYDDICDDDIEDELEQYFECTEVESYNGLVAYIGPHCAQDGVTVTLGVYSDQYCNDYIGNSVNMRKFLGYDLEEDALSDYVKGSIASVTNTNNNNYDYFDPTDQLCIPCRAGAQLYEQEGNLYHDDAVFDDTEITDLCENLYKQSARCDRHFRNYATKTKMSQYYDKELMQLSCDFIDSVVMGKYDEMGFLIVENSNTTVPNVEKSFLKNNIYYEEYGHYIEEVTGLQVFGLVASILAVCLLGLWSAALHRSLSNKGPWRPRRLNNVSASNDPVALSRQNSGIVFGRSQGSYYMT